MQIVYDRSQVDAMPHRRQAHLYPRQISYYPARPARLSLDSMLLTFEYIELERMNILSWSVGICRYGSQHIDVRFMIPQPIVLDCGRVYVIGDIHGRSDLLEQMVIQISRDLEMNPVSSAVTITLGDYIDRGPDSRGVLERLARNPFPTDFVALKGNHEVLFEAFLGDPTVAHHWRRLGGLETLHSYGVPIGDLMMRSGYEQAAAALQAAVPDEHFRFLASLRISIVFDRYFMCHAGVRPGIKLDRQSAEDLLWIRDEFLSSTADFGKIVVHGHTPNQRLEILPNRINIDTGAFVTGRLTCAVLGHSEPRFLVTA
jgi:serine/threonine protein phosphatase 1